MDCNGTVGVLRVAQNGNVVIRYEDENMHCGEFERRCGKGRSRKWKETCRVLNGSHVPLPPPELKVADIDARLAEPLPVAVRIPAAVLVVLGEGEGDVVGVLAALNLGDALGEGLDPLRGRVQRAGARAGLARRQRLVASPAAVSLRHMTSRHDRKLRVTTVANPTRDHGGLRGRTALVVPAAGPGGGGAGGVVSEILEVLIDFSPLSPTVLAHADATPLASA